MEGNINLEDFALVWLDFDSKSKLTKTRLRTIINFLKTFDDPTECFDYISSSHCEKILVIVSGAVGETFVPLIHGMSQILFIYVFCTDQSRHEQWSNSYSKMHGIFADQERLYSTLLKDLKYVSNSSAVMISIGSNDINHSLRDLKADQGTFFWFQLLIDTLLRIPQTAKAKEDFLVYCRSHYNNNVPELIKIDEFREKYHSDNAIFWYTRDSFVYRLLNKAFRTENIDIIFKFRFFVIDLYNQLQNLSTVFIDTLVSTKVDYLTVYRGQEISSEELQKLQNNIGNLISMNTFLSTTTVREIALIYAGNGSNRPFLESVLFEVVIDFKKGKVPTKFANIENLSYFKSENEVLFAMATVFTVDSVEKLGDENIWKVCLKLSYDEDQQQNLLIEHLKMELSDQPTEADLGDLFLSMTDYQRAENYCKLVINECKINNDTNLMKRLHGIIGISHLRRSQFEDAMTNFKIILDILRDVDEDSTFDFVTLGTTYSNIGLVFRLRNDWKEALAYYDRSLDAYAQALPQNHPLIATAYNNISMVHFLEGNYEQAIHAIQIAFEIRREHLPHLHPLMSDTYGLLGDIYRKKSEYKLALHYFEKTLESREKYLPANSYLIMDTYKSITELYTAENRYDEALMFLTKIVEIRQQSATDTHNSIPAALFLLFVDFYLKKGEDAEVRLNDTNTANMDYRTALDYCQKLIDPSTTPIVYNYMAVLNIRLGDHQAALHCLDVNRSFIVGSDSIGLGIWYNNMAKVFVLKQEWKKAEEYYQKALHIYRSKLTSDHHLLSKWYYNVGEMYEKMNQLRQAQNNYKQAYSIDSKKFPLTHINVPKCEKAIYWINAHLEDNNTESF